MPSARSVSMPALERYAGEARGSAGAAVTNLA
jgi:hypothetical protein